MRASLIYDEVRKLISTSRNLRNILSYANRCGGVSGIDVRAAPDVGNTPLGTARVLVRYQNGYLGVTDFVCHAHACKWARKQSARPNSWWTGATVTTDETAPT
jgi:hypothetical protein